VVLSPSHCMRCYALQTIGECIITTSQTSTLHSTEKRVRLCLILHCTVPNSTVQHSTRSDASAALMRIYTAQPALRQIVSAQTCIQAPCALFPNLDDKFKTHYDSRQQSFYLYTAVPRTSCCCFYVVTAWLRY
jgi:hypothetical protein